MSKEREAVTADNYKRRVSAVVRSGKSIRGNIQELMHYAMVSYLDPENNGNTGDLTFLFQSVAGVKSLNHKLLGQYCEDTVNVKLAKTSEGEQVFRKAVKGQEPQLLENADLTANWWEHGRTTEPKAVDILKQLDTMLKTLEATQGDEAKRVLVAGQEHVIDDVMTRVKELRSWTERTVVVRVAAIEAEAGEVIKPTPVAIAA